MRDKSYFYLKKKLILLGAIGALPDERKDGDFSIEFLKKIKDENIKDLLLDYEVVVLG